MRKTPFFLLLLIFLGACKSNSSSNSELFEKHYQKNVDNCVAAMLNANIDSLDAVRKCECMINTLYEIDSSFVRKNNKESNSFVEGNRALVDSLCSEL